jgi:hypothetical protein
MVGIVFENFSRIYIVTGVINSRVQNQIVKEFPAFCGAWSSSPCSQEPDDSTLRHTAWYY